MGKGDPEISRVDYDSRRVKDGSLFVAIEGEKTDGHRYLKDAFAAGAAAAVVSKVPETPFPQPLLRVENTRRALALTAAELAGHPDREMDLVAVTGTNGKTTVVFLLADILHQARGAAGLMGTLGYRTGGELQYQERTTPEAPDIFARLTEMKRSGCRAAAMEVSSHALVMERVYGMRFRAAAFTNLSQDHLDFHRTIEAYFRAKAMLFKDYRIDAAVINLDDFHGRILRGMTGAPVITYAQHRDADVKPERCDLTARGISMEARTPRGVVALDSPLIGEFNVENILCALGVVEALELPREAFITAVRGFRGVPGRMERFDLGDRRAYVDYAHTPDALDSVLHTLRRIHRGPLYVLFGCGGDRDREKRPLMGAVAQKLADRIYLTSDNPRSEDPERIIADILAGISETEKVVVNPDRRLAIRAALDDLPSGGVLLVAGKGHEDYQEVKGVKHPLDDRREIAGYLEERGR